MYDKTNRYEQSEDEILVLSVSDEALEIAASKEKAGVTLAYCSGLSTCPA